MGHCAAEAVRVPAAASAKDANQGPRHRIQRIADQSESNAGPFREHRCASGGPGPMTAPRPAVRHVTKSGRHGGGTSPVRLAAALARYRSGRSRWINRCLSACARWACQRVAMASRKRTETARCHARSVPRAGAWCPRQPQTFNTAVYEHRAENTFLAAKDNPLSTFSIDVDTASYANVRRFIESGSLPPPGRRADRGNGQLFPVQFTRRPRRATSGPSRCIWKRHRCPWNPQDRLVRIGIKGRELARDKRPASNLVFLLDVSGSMEPPERLPLIKASMRLLVEQLTAEDDRRRHRDLRRGKRRRAALHGGRPEGHASCASWTVSTRAARPTARRGISWRTGWRATGSSRAARTASSWRRTAISTWASPAKATSCA